MIYNGTLPVSVELAFGADPDAETMDGWEWVQVGDYSRKSVLSLSGAPGSVVEAANPGVAFDPIAHKVTVYVQELSLDWGNVATPGVLAAQATADFRGWMVAYVTGAFRFYFGDGTQWVTVDAP